jgi:uncharacterized membrane protein
VARRIHALDSRVAYRRHGVSWYEWLLFLHVLAAFAMVGSVVVFTALNVALWNVDRPAAAVSLFRVARPAGVLTAIGGMGTLVLGVWLAIYVDGYELWDGWIATALVLWVVAGGTGERVGRHYTAARKDAERLLGEGRDGPSSEVVAGVRARRPLALHAITVVSVLALLFLMIFKPGA